MPFWLMSLPSLLFDRSRRRKVSSETDPCPRWVVDSFYTPFPRTECVGLPCSWCITCASAAPGHSSSTCLVLLLLLSRRYSFRDRCSNGRGVPRLADWGVEGESMMVVVMQAMTPLVSARCITCHPICIWLDQLRMTWKHVSFCRIAEKLSTTRTIWCMHQRVSRNYGTSAINICYNLLSGKGFYICERIV
jgi:hypothetical protein